MKRRRVENRGWIRAIIDIINVQDMLGLADVRIDIKCRGRVHRAAPSLTLFAPILDTQSEP